MGISVSPLVVYLFFFLLCTLRSFDQVHDAPAIKLVGLEKGEPVASLLNLESTLFFVVVRSASSLFTSTLYTLYSPSFFLSIV